MSDPQFLARALRNLDELRALLLNRNRRFSNRALDQAADDLAGVAIRVLRGRKCAGPGCSSDVTVTPILTEMYCSTLCKNRRAAQEAETAARVADAIAQYSEVPNAG